MLTPLLSSRRQEPVQQSKSISDTRVTQTYVHSASECILALAWPFGWLAFLLTHRSDLSLPSRHPDPLSCLFPSSYTSFIVYIRTTRDSCTCHSSHFAHYPLRVYRAAIIRVLLQDLRVLSPARRRTKGTLGILPDSLAKPSGYLAPLAGKPHTYPRSLQLRSETFGHCLKFIKVSDADVLPRPFHYVHGQPNAYENTCCLLTITS